MKATLYKKVMVQDHGFPDDGGEYFTDQGLLFYKPMNDFPYKWMGIKNIGENKKILFVEKFWPDWWLKEIEIEIPENGEIYDMADGFGDTLLVSAYSVIEIFDKLKEQIK